MNLTLQEQYNPYTRFPRKFRYYYHDKQTKQYYGPIANLPNLTPPKKDPKMSNINYLGTLTPEQSIIYKSITERNTCSGTVMMKTGRGKSHLIFALTSFFQTSTLILCHNIDTADDMYKKILQFTSATPEQVWLIHSKASKAQKEIRPITITTHAGFSQQRQEYRWLFRVLIYDECDFNLSTPSRQDFVHCMSSAIIMSDADAVYWFSWTPYRETTWTQWVNILFGPTITDATQLNNWYNIIPEIEQIQRRTPSLYLYETWWELRKNIIEDVSRQKTQIRFILEQQRLYNLVLFENIVEVDEYYTNLMSQSDVHKYTIIKLHWQMSAKEYEENLQLLEQTITNKWRFIIVATADKIGRGVDIPIIDTIYLFFPNRFRGTTVQAVGRALRLHPWKSNVKVFDWVDASVSSLNRQAKERVKTYIREYGIKTIPVRPYS